jgi:adenosylmethionine-8-amino-7-oxononanoate aminotransferase
MALGFWANRGEPRHRILVLEHAYHGDTVGGMSVGARGVFSRSYEPLLFDVGRLPFPSPGQEQALLDALDQACNASDPPAALMVEPLILGAGGMLIYPAHVLSGMRAICARHRVLFIADEVMTGWGRTGTLFACEQAAVVPDIICLSKGLTGGSLPLAVTVATAPIFEAHRSTDRSRMFFHSSSYTANPIACAAARANLQIWRDEPVLARIDSLAARQRDHLDRLAALPAVTGTRQIGTITACEVGDPRGNYLSSLAPKLLAFFQERDVLLRPLGNTIYVMPPYCIGEDDLATVYETAAEAISLM